MLTWIRKGVTRQLLSLVATCLAVITLSAITITFFVADFVDRHYQTLIFGQIVPGILHMGEDHFQAEERAIQAEELDVAGVFLKDALALAAIRSDVNYPADSYRDHIPDRRVRGGIDKPGAVFVTVNNDGLVWLYCGLRDVQGGFAGVRAVSFVADRPQDLAASFRTMLEDRQAALQGRKSKLADDRLALGNVWKLIDPVIANAQSSRDEVSHLVRLSQLAGAGALLTIAMIGGGLVAVVMLRLTSVIVFQARSMADMVRADTVFEATDLLHVQSRRSDELGLLAQGTCRAAEAFQQIHRLEAERLEVENRQALDRAQMLDQLAADLRDSVQSAVRQVGQAAFTLHDGARVMLQTVDLTARESSDASRASEASDRQMQMISAAAEQLSMSIQQVQDQVSNSLAVAEQAVHIAQETQQTAQSLNQVAERIGDVVNLITVIAAKTNLLAMNASIEAARAGEAGMGFSIVAGEVKGLALRTSGATAEIEHQIRLIVGQATEVVDDVEHFAAVVSHINNISQNVSSLMGTQLSATHDIARNIHRAAENAQSVTCSIDLVNRSVKQAEEASSAVMSSADALENLSVTLQRGLDTFFANLHQLGLGRGAG